MTLRPKQMRGPAKKITRETLREKPWLAALARLRAKQLREVKRANAGRGQQELFKPDKSRT